MFKLIIGNWYDYKTQTNVQITKYGNVSSSHFKGLKGRVSDSFEKGSNFAFSSSERECLYYITFLGSNGDRSDWKLLDSRPSGGCPPGGNYEIIPDPERLLEQKAEAERRKAAADAKQSADQDRKIADSVAKILEERQTKKLADQARVKAAEENAAAQAAKRRTDAARAASATQATAKVEQVVTIHNNCNVKLTVFILIYESSSWILKRFIIPADTGALLYDSHNNPVKYKGSYYVHAIANTSPDTYLHFKGADTTYNVDGINYGFYRTGEMVQKFDCN